MYQTTQKSKDMITHNGSRSTIGQQLYALIAKHGLENIAESLLHLCHDQSNLNQTEAIEISISHLEKLIESASKIQSWN
jgi:hypothetical protein